MARRKTTTDPPPPKLSANDLDFVARVREAESDVQSQERKVGVAQKQLSEQRALLRRRLSELRNCAAGLPLFDAASNGG